MSRPAFTMALRLRLRTIASAAAGLVMILIVVGALFPAVGDSIGKLDLPEGVSDLLGGADYGTLVGWYKGEIVSVYGPLVFAGIAITGAASVTAGEEEDRILALVLAHPVRRSSVVAAKGAAIAVGTLGLALATWAGLIVGVAAAGGGIGPGHLAALCLHLALYGVASGALALAIGAGTGRRVLATGIATGFALLAYLVNGLAPLVGAIEWLKYLSPYYYYTSGDPLRNGINIGGLVVLALLTAALTAAAMIAIERRDLRG